MKDMIGMLDSGVGGISVLKKAAELLPNENFIYFGDNLNAPYGPRPLSEIHKLSKQVTDYLIGKEIKALVIACNTITAAYADELRSYAEIPVIGMEPAVKPASKIRGNGCILTLATKATLSLQKFSNLMAMYGEGVIPVEGKGLVELVESGKYDSEEAKDTLFNILNPYLDRQINGIVLGCTHYPFLRQKIEELLPGVPIFDGREGTVRQLARRMEAKGLLTDNTSVGSIEFETSAGKDVLELMKKLFEANI